MAQKNNNTLFARLFQRLIRPLPYSRRKEVIAEITPMAGPSFDFLLLVVLSSAIATLGLITNSPAVIIGAMLVAPLMSPIIGIGLASITGDTLMLRRAISALLRGAVLAIALSALLTFINSQLPILSLQTLPQEVLSRTRPTPIDLVIALAGGLAAAYAMTQKNLSAALPGVAIATALMPPLCTVGIGIALGRGDVAGGALLLFTTNAVTIAFSSVLIFFLLGFGASTYEGGHRLPGSLLLSAALTLVILIPLSYFSLRFFQEAAQNQQVNAVVKAEVNRLGNAELTEMQPYYVGNTLDLNLTIRTTAQLTYEQVVSLQQAIVDKLKGTRLPAYQPGPGRTARSADPAHRHGYPHRDLHLYPWPQPNNHPQHDCHRDPHRDPHYHPLGHTDRHAHADLYPYPDPGARRDCHRPAARAAHIPNTRWPGHRSVGARTKNNNFIPQPYSRWLFMAGNSGRFRTDRVGAQPVRADSDADHHTYRHTCAAACRDNHSRSGPVFANPDPHPSIDGSYPYHAAPSRLATLAVYKKPVGLPATTHAILYAPVGRLWRVYAPRMHSPVLASCAANELCCCVKSLRDFTQQHNIKKGHSHVG